MSSEHGTLDLQLRKSDIIKCDMKTVSVVFKRILTCAIVPTCRRTNGVQRPRPVSVLKPLQLGALPHGSCTLSATSQEALRPTSTQSGAGQRGQQTNHRSAGEQFCSVIRPLSAPVSSLQMSHSHKDK